MEMGPVKDTQFDFEILDKAHFHNPTGHYRHVACDPCRRGKVKCDGGKPFCKRCVSSQAPWECSYARAATRKGRPRKRGSDPGPSRTAQSPSNATSASCTTPSDPSREDEDDCSGKTALCATPKPVVFPAGPTALGDDGYSIAYCDTPESKFPSLSVSLSLSDGAAIMESGNDGADSIQFKDMSAADITIDSDFQTTLQVADTAHDCLPRELTETLLSLYHNSCQQTFRCFDDQKNLLCLLDQPGYEAMALKYAICTHALALSPGCSRLLSATGASVLDPIFSSPSSYNDNAGFCYRLARAALNQSDATKGSTTQLLLQVLQATVLVSLYELQRADFRCAWMSTSRAVWLTEEMQLHCLDSDRTPSLTLAHEKQVQEARRAFWAASSLVAFLMMAREHILPISVDLDEKVTTYLPESFQRSNPTRISDVYHGTTSRMLSVEEGLWAVRVLSIRVFLHARDGIKQTSDIDSTMKHYNFWTHQNQLQESLNYLQMCAEASTAALVGLGSPDSMLLDTHIKALSVILSEANLAKMFSGHGLGFNRGKMRCYEDATYQSALELGTTLVATEKTLPTDVATNLTISWAIYTTLQSLLRHQRRQLTATTAMDSGNPLDLGETTICHNGNSHSLGLISNYCATNPESMAFCLTAPEPSSWSLTTATLTDALVRDSFEALQSALTKFAGKFPVASIFLEQIRAEINLSTEALQTRPVGLTGRA